MNKMFNEKEIFVGIAIFIIIGSLLFLYFFMEGLTITGNAIKLSTDIDNENYCGDNYCYIDDKGDYENCNTCSKDCGNCENLNSCGDNICSIGECKSCFSDCSYLKCENGICEKERGESCLNSPNDCGCKEDYYCVQGICEDSKEDIYEIKSNWDYPLIFVHGHSVSEVGSKYSISAFNEFQDKLISDKLYIEREPIIASDNEYNFIKNQWANSELPISIRTTYYLGEYTKDSNFIYGDNNQNIEEYAKRLDKIINLVRYATGRNKVDIVAHSMGGLVSREYIRQTNGNYVNKLVTIGTPNNGIYGYIAFGCEGFFGRTQNSPECEEMQSNSLFISKLNNGDLNYRNKYLTISGKAKEVDFNDRFKRELCPDNKSPHDEVVCSLSVSLEGARNEYVEGNQIAGKGNTFHSDLVSPFKVPKVYEKVVEFLN